jgi:hypothetical protein
VIAGLASGNRDEIVYNEPGRFWLDCIKPKQQLSFGYGSHWCIGSGLARTEAGETLGALLGRFPPGSRVELMPLPYLLGRVPLHWLPSGLGITSIHGHLAETHLMCPAAQASGRNSVKGIEAEITD